MDREVRLVMTTERPTAVVAEATTWSEFPALWRDLLDQVYSFLKERDVRQEGHNIMLFKDDVPNVEVGVEVAGRFSPAGRVAPSVLPSGPTAMTVHRGPYGGLDSAHRAVRDWCQANGHGLTGTRLEIYGDWKDDPEELETEVFYQLR
jgi:effector-binding domain-containing protein